MPSDLPKHAIRDGDYRVIYVVGHKGLYKYFPDANYIAMMKNIDFAGGEVGQMVGYGALTMFPPAGGVRVLVPTTTSADPGGLWVHTVAKDASGTNIGTWVLKNGAGGANALPTNWYWHNVAASPRNGNTIAMYGSSGNSTIKPTDTWPDGVMEDANDHVSPLWMTNDGGDNWFPVTLPAPAIAQLPDAHIDANEVWLSYNDVNTPILFAKVLGIGNFFGTAQPGATMWWGDPSALKVRAAFFNGTDTPAPEGDYYFGTAIDNGFISMVHGVSGEMVASGNFGTHTSDVPPYPGARVIWIADPIAEPPYPPANWNTRGLQLASLDRTVNPATGIIGVSGGDIYYTPEYHSSEPGLALAKEAPELGYSGVVSTAVGVVAKRPDGIYLINDIGGGGSPVLQIATSPMNLTSSRQGARQVVAGRMSYLGGTGDDALQANFVIFDGDSWTTLLGPTDVQGKNAMLSAEAIAVTEG